MNGSAVAQCNLLGFVGACSTRHLCSLHAASGYASVGWRPRLRALMLNFKRCGIISNIALVCGHLSLRFALSWVGCVCVWSVLALAFKACCVVPCWMLLVQLYC